MNDPDQTHRQSEQPARQQPPEVHREREVIVTGGSDRGSGAGTAVAVILGLVVLAVVAVLGFMYLQRDGGGIPDEVDVNIQLPDADADQ